MVIQALKKVFQRPGLVVLSLIVSMLVFAFAVWLPNIQLITVIVSSPDISFVSKFELMLSLLGSISTNFTLFSASYTIIIAVLFGMYIATTVYFMKCQIKKVGQGGVVAGFLGIGSGVLGVGCAACGSFLLTSALSLLGASSALALLPLGGSEFGILGVIFLGIALHKTAKQIENPLVCKITN